MANICENTITVVGLKEDPEIFVKELSKAMFQIDLDNLDPKQWGEDPEIDGKTWYPSLVGRYRQKGSYLLTYRILYPDKPYNRLGIAAPRFHVDTKWKPPQDELMEASKVFPDLTFDLSWWVEQDGPSGEFVIKHGDIVEGARRLASWYLFDSLQYPAVGLLPAHVPYTLAQRGTLRIQDAVDIIKDLRNILDDDRFKNSPHTPFSECRDKEKTEKLRAGLAALHESLAEQAKQLDFSGVFLEEQELTESYPAVVEADKTLMESLGLRPLLRASGEAVRLSILPFKVLVINASCRAIVPVLRYLNADPTSGKYISRVDGSGPPIECEIRYVCLTRIDMMQVRRLPDASQTPYDIDIVMAPGNRDIGFEFNRASNQARWKRNFELAAEVEQRASELSDELAAKTVDRPDLTLFDNFQKAVEAVLFPMTVK